MFMKSSSVLFVCRRGYCRRRGNHELGASLVEYGLIVGFIFLPLLFGIGGFGHALFVYHHLNSAAKEATRYAAVRGSTCNQTPVNDSSCVASNSASGITGPTTQADVTQFVKNITSTGIDTTKLTVTACGVSDTAACTASSPEVCTAAVGALAATPNYPGCTVQVQVQYAYNFIFPMIRTAVVNMSSTSDLIIVH
jgi:Flp pilus assembly protein TadG